MNAKPHVVIGAGAAFLAALASVPAWSDSSDYYTHLLNSERYATTQNLQSAQPRYGSTPVSGELHEIVVRHGDVVEGPSNIVVDHGTPVTMVIDTDVNDVVRVDGYGYTVPAAPGEPGMLRFAAERPGQFMYRSLRTGQVLGVIEVGPARLGSWAG
ncbi:MAG TPA: hypothetical protein VJM11_09175 [Nevskiaceae bacterium]|nr:hypothetical protein [Nevskiaceae bacterium]